MPEAVDDNIQPRKSPPGDGADRAGRGSDPMTLRRRGICVVIPTYNNHGTIADVVRRALFRCLDVIVVSDGSTDGTLKILQGIKDITLVHYEKNAGKGTALKRGFEKALEMGFSYAITLDGDGQHFPEDIPLLVEANIQNPGCLIVGKRKGLETMQRSRGSKFANAFSNFWFAVQTGHYLKDTQTGYRLYPLKKLYGLGLLTSRYEAELELMVFASWHGVRIVSTPVDVYYPPKEERVSHFRPAKDFTRIFVLNTVLCVLALVYALPLKIIRLILALLRNIYSFLVFAVLTLLVMTPAAMLYMNIGKVTQKKRDNLHRLLQSFSRFILLVHKIPGVRFTVGNPHKEDFSRPSLIICNHQSHLDLLALLIHSPRIVVLTNDWVWNDPFYGYVIRNAEFYPVSDGLEALLPRLRDLVERGYSIAVYPEGTRSKDCQIGRFHQGAFFLAQQLDLDILPMVLYGAGKALPKNQLWIHRYPVRVEIDERMTQSNLQDCGQTLREKASALRRYYKRRYQEMADRMEQDV